jgi:vacuolar-type H+-ATPase subunit H
MVPEKSVLQQVREKELMFSIKIFEARGSAEEVIQSARKEASEMIENSEKEGKKAAREFYDREMEIIRQDVERLKSQGIQKAKATQAEAERNLEPAIRKIVTTVSMG